MARGLLMVENTRGVEAVAEGALAEAGPPIDE